MVEYNCDKCKKKFNHKTNYLNHINRKTSCIVDETEKESYYFCEFCDKKYNRKDNLTRHLKTCKIKIQNESTMTEIDKLKNELAILKEKIEAKESSQINANAKNGNAVNNNHSNINTQNNTNNINIINILPFLEDDMSHLTKKDKKMIVKKCYESIPELIKKVNFNPDMPCNHNVYISNLKSGHGHVKSEKKWVMMKLDQLLDDFINKKRDDIEEILDEYEDELPEKVVDKVRDVIASIDYEPAIDDPAKNDAVNKKKLKYKKRVLDEVKLILFNNKDIVLGTKKCK
jgi:hypothetical protein